MNLKKKKKCLSFVCNITSVWNWSVPNPNNFSNPCTYLHFQQFQAIYFDSDVEEGLLIQLN